MRRSPMPPRTSPISRSPMKRGPWTPAPDEPCREPIRRKQLTAEEKRARFARVYGSGERVEFVRRLPCLVCSSEPCDNAHTSHPSAGMGRKGDYSSIVPLCTGPTGHHAALHRMGQKSFEEKYSRQLLGRTLTQWAELVEHAWSNRQ